MTARHHSHDARSRVRFAATLCSFAWLLTGCGDIYLDAPRGTHVNLMPANRPAKIRQEQVVWFKWWGNEPFYEPETHAATIIERYQLSEARIRMVSTFADGFISTFTGPVGFPRRTLIVEGNPATNTITSPAVAPNGKKE